MNKQTLIYCIISVVSFAAIIGSYLLYEDSLFTKSYEDLIP